MSNSIVKAFTTRCVESSYFDMDDYYKIRKEITYRTFVTHIGRRNLIDFEVDLGYRDCDGNLYNKSLSLKTDYHVQFGKGKFKGIAAVDCTHSAIEYIFQ